MKSEKISFIVVSADGKDYLAVLLPSIFQLDYPDSLIEVVVVDNGSSDGTVEWLEKEWPLVRVIANSENEGFARPNNVAARSATGKWLCLVNNDMKLEKNWLREMLGALEGEKCLCAGSVILDWEGKKIDFDGGAIAFTGHGLQPNHGDTTKKKEKIGKNEKIEKVEIPFACGGAMLIDKNAFLEVGGFDESYFAYYEDVDLGWRLWLYGYEVVLAPGAIAYHRHNATSKKAPAYQKKVLMERNALFSAIKNYEEENLLRILPAALLLANKRMCQESQVEKKDFIFSLSGLPKKKEISEKNEIPWAKAWRSLYRKGLSSFLKKVAVALATKVLKRWGRPPFAEGGVLVDRSAYATAIALEEVADHLDELLAKRAVIQKCRRRPDSEVLPLFLEPLRAIDGNPSYLKAQKAFLSSWGIERVFDIPKLRP